MSVSASNMEAIEIVPTRATFTTSFALGQIMGALDAKGLADDTLLIFTSNNGPEGKDGQTGGSTGGLRGRKRDCHEGGIRVPGIVRWPGHIKPGTVSRVPVIGSDIFAQRSHD